MQVPLLDQLYHHALSQSQGEILKDLPFRVLSDITKELTSNQSESSQLSILSKAISGPWFHNPDLLTISF